jgi:RNA polymerase sigma factor (TIGR02999 family)
LVGGAPQQWNSRGHFFAAAGEAMRRILIESARRKQSQRRGGGLEPIELSESALVLARPSDEVLAVHDSLDKLAAADPLTADFVKLRYFVGMTVSEAADALAISPRTADRLWAYARTWLRTAIDKDRAR